MCLVLLITSNSLPSDSIPNPNLLSKEPVLMYSCVWHSIPGVNLTIISIS